MADVQSNIQVSIDATQALASIKNLQRQISAFHSSMAKGGAAANAVSTQLQQTLINSVNATGQFSAGIRTIRTTTESFTSSLEKNKFSLGEYFRYAGGATKTFGRLFKTEHDTINKVARENVKDLQTQYIRLGRDASGAMKAIAVRPLSLDMTDLGTRTQIAAQKQAILNQLLKQGSTNLLNFGKNTQWAGRQLMVGFTLPLMALGSAASKTFMDMETQAIRFKKVYGDLFTPTGESQQALKDIQDLGKEFTKYGIAVSTTVGLAAEAAAAGFKGVDLQRQTAAATKLSILGQVESQKALETTISLQNAFSMSSENLAESIDFLNAVENQTVLSLDDISTAIPKAAPIVQQLGGDVKDLAFLMTAMKEGGINASEGANALKSGLASLINPTGKANEMLLGFGINAKKIVVDNKGDLKKTVVEFATALNQLDPLNRAQAIEQMFGKFQFSRLSTLFANVTKEGTQASRVLDLAGASVQELASLSEKELGMTSESAMNKFKGAIENLKLSLIPLGEEFLKAVTPIAEFITRILEKFDSLSANTKKIIVTITAVVAGLGPVFLMTFGLLANGIANIIKGFTFLKTLFNKTGQSTATLGTEVKYMTAEQRNAAAVAASLDQIHTKLSQTFTSEASAVNALTQAYQRAIAAQSQFVPVAPPITRGPIKKFAGGRPATVGGTGNKDSELALLMPGETVIPTAMSKKYGGIINAMIADRIPGYEDGKPKTGSSNISLYPEYAMRLQPAAENMAQRAGTTGVGEVLSPLALRIGEARGISPTSSQISAGRFDDIYKEYESITTEFVDRLNTEYNTTFADIKDENERMRKSWSAAGKAVEKQVDSITSDADRGVIRKTFGLDEDVYGTIPTDSREAGGTTPNRARRGAFKSRLSGFRSYTRIRPGAKKLFERMTGRSAADLQMGHVFPPRTVDISTLESDPRKSGSVATARAVMERGKQDAESYEAGKKKGKIKDPYVTSTELTRKSPHPQAAKDGRDDARSYATARDKELRKQSGRARRVATRAQGPAPIGATPQPGMTVLPIVPGGSGTPPDPDTKPKTRLAGMAGKMTGMGGGMGLLGANMGLSMLPDFAGKGMIQGTLAGANLGMMFGPYGMAAGAAIGGITSAFTALIAKEKEHAANVKATFTPSTEMITLFGDKVFDATVKVTNLGMVTKDVKTGFGAISPEIQAIVDAISKLPEDNPLSKLIKRISDKNTSLTSITGSIKANVAAAISTGGLDPKNAEKYVQALLAAANRTKDFAVVWKSVSKDVRDATTATTTSFNKLDQAVKRTGEQFFFADPMTATFGLKKYKDLNAAQQSLADELLTTFSIIANGTLTLDQINERIAGLEASSLDATVGVDALRIAVENTGNADLIARFNMISSSFDEVGRSAEKTGPKIMMMYLATEMLASQGKTIASEQARLFGTGASSVSSAFYTLQNILNDSGFDDLFTKWQESVNNVNDYKDGVDGVDGLSAASTAYLKVLDKQIKGLEEKRDAQKNANDEVQRQIDLEMKLKDLAKQSVLAKISGDYIGAASLQQQAQNVQFEFDQETELRKKDAEIARLKARAEAIRGGAKLTKAESAKIPKDSKAKEKARGGMIRGAGTGTSDSIPAYLSNGEYVVKAKSVKKYGTGTLDALNAGRFAEGGLVQSSTNREMQKNPLSISVGDGKSLPVKPYGSIFNPKSLDPKDFKTPGEYYAAEKKNKKAAEFFTAPKTKYPIDHIKSPMGSLQRFLDIARSQIGYDHAYQLHTDFYRKGIESNANKFSIWGNEKYKLGSDILDWCGMFIAWVAQNSGVGLSTKMFSGIQAIKDYKKKGLFNDLTNKENLANVKVGDLAWYDWDTPDEYGYKKDGLPDHAVIVSGVGKIIRTIGQYGDGRISERTSGKDQEQLLGSATPEFKKLAMGGTVLGKGTATSDSIPAMLSNGEYVVKAKSVKKYGVGALDALNSGKFADGGPVGSTATADLNAKPTTGSKVSDFIFGDLTGLNSFNRIISGKASPLDYVAVLPMLGAGAKTINAVGRSAIEMIGISKGIPGLGSLLPKGSIPYAASMGSGAVQNAALATTLFSSKLANIGFSDQKIAEMASEKAAAKIATKTAKEQAGIGFRGNLNLLADSPFLSKVLPKVGSLSSIKAAAKIKEKIGQPLSPYELELLKAARQAQAGGFTPIEELLSTPHSVLVKELEQLTRLTGFTPDDQFMFTFTPAKVDSLPNPELLSMGLKNLADEPLYSQEFLGGLHTLNFTHVGTGRPAATLSWDSVTGIIKGMYTQPEFQRQGLATFANKYAASITRLSHSKNRTPEGRAYSKAIGGIMPGENISKPTPILRELANRLGIKPIVPVKPSSSSVLTDEEYSALQRSRGMSPDSSGLMPSGYRYAPESDPAFEAAAKARYEAELAAANKVTQDRLNWRANINRTYGSYPFGYSGQVEYEDMFDLEQLMKLPNYQTAPAGVPWRPESMRPQRDLPFIGSKTSAATGGYLDKGKLRVPRFANGGLIKGPGTGISDSIQAGFGYAGGGSIRVSNGEYVIKASSVKDYGVKTMDAINNGTATVGTNSGGTVYNINMPVTSNNANPEIVANEVMRKLKLEVSKNNKSNKVGK